MAKDAKPAEDGAQPPKKSKKLLIIIVAALLVLVLGGAAAFFLMKGGDHAEDEEAAEETVKPKKKEKKKAEAHPVFINMDAFTVNLVPENGDQYLQVVVSLELEGPENEPEIKGHLPKIRNNLTLLLSSKKASELMPKAGKEQLAEQMRDEINLILNPPRKSKKGEPVAPDGPVLSVLFTSFIIQ